MQYLLQNMDANAYIPNEKLSNDELGDNNARFFFQIN